MSEAGVDRLLALEIGVPDLAASSAFYEQVWGLRPVLRTEEACYLRATGTDCYVLALHRRQAPSFVRVRLAAADRRSVDSLASRVRQVGAEGITAPGPLATPGGGYGFALRDPDGREIQILCEAETHAAMPAKDRPAKLSHVVLNSPDIERGAAFLRDALGFRLRDRTKKAAFMGCGPDHHSMAITDRKNTHLSHVAFELPSLDAVLRGCGRLKAAGLKIEWGVGRHGTGDNVFAYFVDPNNGFAIEYTGEMEQIDDATYVVGSPESIARAAYSDVWGLAEPPTQRLLQAFQGPG